MATTDLSAYDKNTIPNSKDLRFGIVVSEWNDHITNNLFQGAFDAFMEHGVLKENIVRWNVPGSFELFTAVKSYNKASRC
jgi:6,7-dimethyl-8-ribityllumazine synthase